MPKRAGQKTWKRSTIRRYPKVKPRASQTSTSSPAVVVQRSALLRLPPEIAKIIACLLPARCTVRLRLVCRYLRDVVDTHENQIVHQLHLRQLFRLLPLVKHINTDYWPSSQDPNERLATFLAGMHFWIAQRGLNERPGQSRCKAQDWMCHCLLTHLHKRGIRTSTLEDQGVKYKLREWIEVAHQTMYLLIHHHHQRLKHHPADSLDSADNFASFITIRLGHAFTGLDLKALFDAVANDRTYNRNGTLYTGRVGAWPKGAVLTRFATAYQDDFPLNDSFSASMLGGGGDMAEMCDWLRLQRLHEASALFAYYLRKDDLWAYTFLKNRPLNDMTPKMTAAVVESVAIH